MTSPLQLADSRRSVEMSRELRRMMSTALMNLALF
eukprot:CAMPEP_0170167970 /NCGR_PEP_ID=MMETSP0040_2-20121228/1193_1 /TAXON_ID=641309 /ORGANISM="Lotharella oceanica, Strain CCMP622" /LENGTH=34 /DNA_ID= /DNA_START= /DNA_END= /DNA_ORIENTATION=